jgi:hypothetical protein
MFPSERDLLGNRPMRIAGQLGLTKGETIHLGDFVVPHPAIIIRQQGRSLASHNGRLSVRASKGIYGLKGLPDRRHENLDRLSMGTDENARGDVSMESAKRRHNALPKVFQVSGGLSFCSSS